MNRSLKVISCILAALLFTGVMSTANPVFAADANEKYSMKQASYSMQNRSVTEENTSSKIRIDDKYDYHKKDVGRAGTFYFNDYTSQVHIVREDLSLYCPNLPVQITSYYNSDETDYVNGLGYGWRTSYHQKIIYNSADNTFRYYDGRSNYIVFEDNGEYNSTTREWVEAPDYCSKELGYTLYTPLNNYTDYSQVTIESNGLVRKFDSDGYLTKITKTLKTSENSTDETEFSVTVDYLSTNNLHLIDKITDSLNREYRFSYSYNSTCGKYVLNTIQVYNASGAEISLSSSTPVYKMGFVYNYITINGATYPTLAMVIYPDGEVFEYTINNSTVLLKNASGYAVEVTGMNTTTQTIKEKAYTSYYGFKTGSTLTVTKTNDYQKVFKDNNNISKTKQFDNYGRTINNINNDGSNVPVVHKNDTSGISEQNEELYNLHCYNKYNTETNLLTNSSFSNGKTGWDASNATVVSEHSNSLKFNTNVTSTTYASQIVSVPEGEENDKYVVEFATKLITNTDNDEFFTDVRLLARKKVNGTEAWKTLGYIDINPLNNNWQTYAVEFQVTEDYNELKLGIFYAPYGEAYFDDVKLFKSAEEEQLNLEELLESVEGLSFDITNEKYATGKLFKIAGDTKELATSSSFSTWTNQTVTDYNNNNTRYLYNSNTGLLTRTIDGNNGNVLHSYNAIGELTAVSQVVSGLGTLSTSYDYSGDKISKVTHNGFSYNYEYDVWGNITSVKVGTQPLVSYEYTSNNTDINKITYGNGDYTTYTYNSAGEISTIKSYLSVGTLKSHFTYIYNNGKLSKITDVVNGTEILYSGDDFTIKNTSSNDVYYSKTSVGKNTLENYGSVCYYQNRDSEDFKMITSATFDDEDGNETVKQYKFNSDKDEFGRVTEKSAITPISQQEDFYISSEYTYKDISATQTSLLVESYSTSVGLCEGTDSTSTETFNEIQYFYDYDSVGNITRIYLKDYDEDGCYLGDETICSYTYDKAGQLTRENNALLDVTYVYAYDIGGNIVSKTIYDFEEVDLSELTPNDTITYGYDGTWKDKLTNVNGTTINYDSMGNPLNYVFNILSGEATNGTLTWNGRQLASVQTEDSRFEYFYDQNGLRTKSIQYDEENNISTITRYVWDNGVLAGYSIEKPDTDAIDTVKILFDDTGDSIGYTYYSTSNNNYQTFYFEKNLQGDIVSVYDDEGTHLVTYNYDAWGNITPETHGGDLATAIRALVALMVTPITYRGYNYDINTGLYYLQSRYYNPTYGRFLNADTTEILEKTKGTVLGANLFAYCNNNPVMNVDYTGEMSALMLAIILAAIVFMIITGVSFYTAIESIKDTARKNGHVV